MDIKLPDYFLGLLEKEDLLLESVRKAFREFGQWLEHSEMPFFPGFTDHSPRHINDVLDTASSLISDDARGILSAGDAYVLSLAILLHDCGMHLTQDGFRSLISDDAKPICPEFDHQSWHILWTEFLSEASRFSQQKLLGIFGDTKPLEVGKFDSTNLTEREAR